MEEIGKYRTNDSKEDIKELEEEYGEDFETIMLKELYQRINEGNMEYAGLPQEKINSTTPKEFVELQIKRIQESMENYTNPTSEIKFKYSEEFIKSQISYLSAEISKYKEILNNPKALIEEYNAFKNRALQLEEEVYSLMNEKGLKLLEAVPDYGAIPIGNLIYPKEVVITSDKISNTIWTGKVGFNSKEAVAVERRGAEQQLNTFIQLITSAESDKVPDNINSEDMRVFQAVSSLTLLGNKVVTLGDIHKAIESNPKAKARKNRLDEINDSISKLATTRLYIDCSEEKEYNYPDLKVEYDGQMINVDRRAVTRRGSKQVGLMLGSPSVLFRYASDKNQIIRENLKVANTPIDSTKRNRDLRDYMLRRVSKIVNDHSKLKKGQLTSRQRTVTYKSLYHNLDFNFETNNINTLRTWQRRTEQNIYNILDHYIDTDFIKGYLSPELKVIKDGKAIVKKEHNRTDIKEKFIILT